LERKILLVLFIISFISITPQIFAQEDLGLLIEQQTIVFEVGKYSDITVQHIIESGSWGENRPRIIEILPGEHSNLSVKDEDGDRLNFSYDKDTFEESKYIILNQKLGNYDLIAEYTLENFLEFNQGLWTKEIAFSHDVIVKVDDDISMIFVNSRPIDVTDAKGINCVGCYMSLEFLDNEETFFIDITDLEISIEVLSNGKISNLEFIKEKKLLNFEVEKNNQLFVLKIPFKLILNPFEVYFADKEKSVLEQTDKIRKTEFSQHDTHVYLSFRTFGEGKISILGAPLDDHEKRLDQVAKMKASEVESSIVKEKKGVVVPIPGQGGIPQNSLEVEDTPQFSFQDELKKGPISTNSGLDGTVILIISGVIAAIIIGIIIKLKR
tara:strand:+ start:1397 stop:2539 length:1143 start_codon:yes stop_codon:yes gene_type:complete